MNECSLERNLLYDLGRGSHLPRAGLVPADLEAGSYLVIIEGSVRRP